MTDSAGNYEVRLQGRLDSRWSVWFDGFSVTTEDGITTLHGHVVDQAALHGLLQLLSDVGIPLISVTRVNPPLPGPERTAP
jgi:hypothetical protein